VSCIIRYSVYEFFDDDNCGYPSFCWLGKGWWNRCNTYEMNEEESFKYQFPCQPGDFKMKGAQCTLARTGNCVLVPVLVAH
jgi:hypothetical protein